MLGSSEVVEEFSALFLCVSSSFSLYPASMNPLVNSLILSSLVLSLKPMLRP